MQNKFSLRMKRLLALPLMLFLMAISMISQGQTVTSDLPDYAPGSTAIITGDGFTAGEDILIHVDHFFDFYGHEDENYTATANEKGSFEFLYQIGWDEDQEFFILTATGQTSANVATCTFTDAALKFTFDLDIVGAPGASATVITSGTSFNGNPLNNTTTVTGVGNNGQDQVQPGSIYYFTFPTNITGNTAPYIGVNYTLVSVDKTSPQTAGDDGFSLKITAIYELACTTPTISATNITDITNTPGQCNASVTFGENITIGGTPTPTVTYTANGSIITSPHTFAVGTTTVTATTNNNGCGTASTTFTVTVTDTEKPVIAGMPSAFNVENDPGRCGAVVSWIAPTATDNCELKSLSSNYNSGYEFPVGTTTVTYTAEDIHSNIQTASFTVTVTNAAPDITVSAPITPFAVNIPVPLTVNFTDNNVVSASIDWGDGSTSPKSITSSFTELHTYTAAGVYTVNVTVTDACNSSDTEIYQYIVVYDPSAGFVTGGGWIESPPGASRDYPEAIGKANFGFVSKYEKGKTVPTGNTEFQFKAGNLNFKSNSYEWLVISGSKAQYKGTGTINGTGNYSFVLTTTDGDISASKSADYFRIRITEGSNRIYDNQLDAANDASLTTTLGGGSIVIHSNVNKPKIAHITPESSASTFEPSLKVFPNPFTERLNIEFSYQTDTKAKLEIFSVTGARLETLYDGPVSGGQLYNFEYLPRLTGSQMVFYHLTLDGKTQVGKVLFNERR